MLGESRINNETVNSEANEDVKDSSSMLDMLAQISEKHGIKISLNVKLFNGKQFYGGNLKGNGPA